MSKLSKERINEVVTFYVVNGMKKTVDTFGLKADTIRKYVSLLDDKEDIKLSKVLAKLSEVYSEPELKALAKGARLGSGTQFIPHIDLTGTVVKVMILSDSHIGSKFSLAEHRNLTQQIAADEMPDMILHAGDITEGMSNRAGHIYELEHIGYKAQKEVSIDWFKGFPAGIPIYVIDGNHDRWYMKGQNIGADIVQDIADMCPNVTKIGSDIGYVNVNGIVIQLWHGGDGASYARSYRIQKIVESITGGTKPNLLITGHDHKEIFLTERNIHCIAAGCLQTQSDFMRGKKLSAHVGVWILTMTINKGRIVRFQPEWIPFYA